MAITIDVNYFNSFYLKRVYGNATGGSIPYATLQGGRATTWVTPITSNVANDWYVEESRIRGGYNNTSMV